MDRRTFVRGVATVSAVGVTGCSGDDEGDDEELVGEGRLRMRNESGGHILLAHGLLEEGTAIEDADLERQELTLDGDEVALVYPDVTGGPYRFVVTAPQRDWQPIEHRWVLEDCVNLTVEVTARPDALNNTAIRCVVGPDGP